MKIERNGLTVEIVESNYLDYIKISEGKDTFTEFIPRILAKRLEQFFEGLEDDCCCELKAIPAHAKRLKNKEG
ncbi:hypothetical protein LCGC14_1303680, partial [marine sediment metagenome]